MFPAVFLITKRNTLASYFCNGMGRLRMTPVIGIAYNRKRACMAGRIRVMTAGIEEPAIASHASFSSNEAIR